MASKRKFDHTEFIMRAKTGAYSRADLARHFYISEATSGRMVKKHGLEDFMKNGRRKWNYDFVVRMIHNHYKRGMSVRELSSLIGIPETTLRTIIKNGELEKDHS